MGPKLTFLGFARVVAILVTYQIAAVRADQPQENPPDFDERVQVVLPSKGSFIEVAGTYRVTADAGSLPANASGKLSILIENPEVFDIPIDQASASCGCTRAELMRNVIPAGGTTELKVHLDTPERNLTDRFVGQIALQIDKDRVKHKALAKVIVVLEFRIEGLLCFNDRVVSIAIPKNKVGQLRLPLVCTVKTPVTDLSVQPSGALEGVVGKITASASDGMHQVELSIDPSVASPGGAFGKLSVADPKSGISDEIDVIVYRDEIVSVSPRTLRFTGGEGPDFSLTASAIVRVRHPSKETDGNGVNQEESSESALFFSASVNGQPVEVTVDPVNGRVYRVRMQLSANAREAIDEAADAEAPPVLAWRAIVGRTVTTGKSPVVFAGY